MAMVILIATSTSVTMVLSKSASRMSKIIVALTIVISLAIVQTPALSPAFHPRPLHIIDLVICLSVAVCIALIIRIGRFTGDA